MSNLRRELRYANNLIHNDEILEDYIVIKKIKKIQKEIDKNEDNENLVSDAYNKIANLYYLIGDEKKANENYKKGLEIKKNNIKIYSSLILHAIEENNLEEAKRFIECIETIEDDNIRKNLELLSITIKLFENNLNLEKVQITDNNILKYIKESNYEFLDIYNNLPVTFNSCNSLMIKKLKTLNYTLIKKNIKSDIENLDTSNYKEIVNKLVKLYNEDKSIENDMIMLSSALIDLNMYTEALNIINIIYKKNPNNYLINYLKKRINEEKSYINMDADDYKKIVFYIEQAKLCKESKDDYGQYNYLLTGKHVTEDPCFDYYLGKYFFKKKDYKTAKQYFKSYEKKGIWKLEKCYYYLYWIEKILKGKPNIYLKKYKKYSCLFEGKNPKYLNDMNRTYDALTYKKDVDFDFVKDRQSNYIDMKEEDFVKEEGNKKTLK